MIKKIETNRRQILLVFSALVIIIIGIPNIISGITYSRFDLVTSPSETLAMISPFLFGLVFIIPGIIILYKSPLIRSLLR